MKHTEQVRDRILEISRGLFARYGLSKTTIDEIARELRMGKSSLYYYFRNKEDIYRAVLEQEVETLRRRVREQVAAARDPREKLKVFGVGRLTWLRELAIVFSALKDDYLNHYGFIQDFRQEYDARETDLVRGILSEGTEKGIFRIDDVELTARAIITALKGLEHELVVRGRDLDIEKNIDALLDLLFYGIARERRGDGEE